MGREIGKRGIRIGRKVGKKRIGIVRKVGKKKNENREIVETGMRITRYGRQNKKNEKG